jgi:hypothetical protein
MSHVIRAKANLVPRRNKRVGCSTLLHRQSSRIKRRRPVSRGMSGRPGGIRAKVALSQSRTRSSACRYTIWRSQPRPRMARSLVGLPSSGSRVMAEGLSIDIRGADGMQVTGNRAMSARSVFGRSVRNKRKQRPKDRDKIGGGADEGRPVTASWHVTCTSQALGDDFGAASRCRLRPPTACH